MPTSALFDAKHHLSLFPLSAEHLFDFDLFLHYFLALIGSGLLGPVRTFDAFHENDVTATPPRTARRCLHRRFPRSWRQNDSLLAFFLKAGDGTRTIWRGFGSATS